MLEKLQLRDFQRHKNLTLRFDPRITSIVGKTDSGKSSIIRALRWAILNQGPTNVVRWGRKRAKVILKVDGSVVVRAKGGENLYKLDGKEFRSFGAGKVPDDVTDLLRMDDNNFQRQHEPAFWFSDSSGKVSKKLNEIINLGQIDSSLKYVATTLRSTKAELQVSRDRLADAREQKKQLRFVKEMEAELEALDSKRLFVTARQKRLTVLEEMVARAEELDKDVEEVPDIAPVEVLKAEFVKATLSESALALAIEDCREKKKRVEQLQAEHEHAHQRFHTEFDGHTCPTCNGKGHL